MPLVQGQHVSIGTLPSNIRSTAYTLTMRLFVPRGKSINRVFIYWQPDAPGYNFMFGRSETGAVGWWWIRSTGSGSYAVYIPEVWDRWASIVAVYDSAWSSPYLRIYLDDNHKSLLHTGSHNTNLLLDDSTGDPVWVGRNNLAIENGIKVKDVGFWTRRLSGTERTAFYKGSKPSMLGRQDRILAFDYPETGGSYTVDKHTGGVPSIGALSVSNPPILSAFGVQASLPAYSAIATGGGVGDARGILGATTFGPIIRY